MSYGFEAVCTYQATDELLKSVKPELDALLVYLELNNLSLLELAMTIEYEDTFYETDDDVSEQVMNLYEEVCAKFNVLHGGAKKGLHLNLSYHNYKQNSQYDDINGFFWELREVRQYTPEAMKVQHMIMPISYVVGG